MTELISESGVDVSKLFYSAGMVAGGNDEVNVKGIRKRLNMTQSEFAISFGISVASLSEWERNTRSPRGATLVLLKVLEKEPEAVLRALA